MSGADKRHDTGRDRARWNHNRRAMRQRRQLQQQLMEWWMTYEERRPSLRRSDVAALRDDLTGIVQKMDETIAASTVDIDEIEEL